MKRFEPRSWAIAASLVLAAVPSSARAEPAGETIDQALCRMIEGAAASHRMPVDFFTRSSGRRAAFGRARRAGRGRRAWRSSCRGPPRERGLADPFDPEQAIPKSAELLDELRGRFGNLGLAAAAYNGGPARVEAWLAGRGGLPARHAIMSRASPAARRTTGPRRARRCRPMQPEGPPTKCLVLVAAFRRGSDRRMIEAYGGPIEESPLAPWGVQLAGNFSKERALASYARARARHADILREVVPMVIGTRMRSRGTRAFYRVRIPAATRQAAVDICGRLHKAGGACVVLKS